MRRALFLLAAAGLLTACTYTNPVLYMDISDPDAIAVDGTYWMTASSFNCRPGLLIYSSTDLVNWRVVNSALPNGLEYQYDTTDSCPFPDGYSTEAHRSTQHGNGVWAPSIRFHDGIWWIFWGDPDYGIYQVHTKDPLGEWSKPHCVIRAKGMIDPCPLWDDDGRVWLVHAWAKSRCGFKSIISLCELNSDCTACISSQTTIFDGNANGNETVEGPKFYKRNGKYIILAPAGGVKTGWQLMLLADSPSGPYEWRTVMHQDVTARGPMLQSVPDNGSPGGIVTFGPHQGAWIDDPSGASWFLHFEDRYAYGRVLHLQPMEWLDDGFCIIGEDCDSDGIGEPVLRHRVPSRRKGADGPRASDPGDIHQYQGIPVSGEKRPERLWDDPNLQLCMLEGPSMRYDLPSELVSRVLDGNTVGLLVLGDDYSSIEISRDSLGVFLRRRSCSSAFKGGTEYLHDTLRIPHSDLSSLQLRICVDEVKNHPEKIYDRRDTYIALCRFEYSLGTSPGLALGPEFIAAPGRWIGARVGAYVR